MCAWLKKMNFDCTNHKLTTKHDINRMWTVEVESSTRKSDFFPLKEMKIFFGLVTMVYFWAKNIYLW